MTECIPSWTMWQNKLSLSQVASCHRLGHSNGKSNQCTDLTTAWPSVLQPLWNVSSISWWQRTALGFPGVLKVMGKVGKENAVHAVSGFQGEVCNAEKNVGRREVICNRRKEEFSSFQQESLLKCQQTEMWGVAGAHVLHPPYKQALKYHGKVHQVHLTVLLPLFSSKMDRKNVIPTHWERVWWKPHCVFMPVKTKPDVGIPRPTYSEPE